MPASFSKCMQGKCGRTRERCSKPQPHPVLQDPAQTSPSVSQGSRADYFCLSLWWPFFIIIDESRARVTTLFPERPRQIFNFASHVASVSNTWLCHSGKKSSHRWYIDESLLFIPIKLDSQTQTFVFPIVCNRLHLERFRLTEKLNKRYRNFPVPSAPTHAQPPLLSIPSLPKIRPPPQRVRLLKAMNLYEHNRPPKVRSLREDSLLVLLWGLYKCIVTWICH